MNRQREKDWVQVYSSTFLPSVEIVKNLLESKGIDAIVLNQQDSAYTSIGEVNLLVKREQVVLAKDLISKAEM